MTLISDLSFFSCLASELSPQLYQKIIIINRVNLLFSRQSLWLLYLNWSDSLRISRLWPPWSTWSLLRCWQFKRAIKNLSMAFLFFNLLNSFIRLKLLLYFSFRSIERTTLLKPFHCLFGIKEKLPGKLSWYLSHQVIALPDSLELVQYLVKLHIDLVASSTESHIALSTSRAIVYSFLVLDLHPQTPLAEYMLAGEKYWVSKDVFADGTAELFTELQVSFMRELVELLVRPSWRALLEKTLIWLTSTVILRWIFILLNKLQNVQIVWETCWVFKTRFLAFTSTLMLRIKKSLRRFISFSNWR